ncbi:universal stress protein [Natronoflexus pectinivorans]|uniref:Nucleotide-binding universal stress UspA family protein n=1 Tax=Natronoflexus pectinivorans TaxID=682526 RepID=A0A4R2GAI9_9BACT|nr:universal stress protein [Natronoflexus pectinivorans]TCO04968.1 nucleotide-binding universal stress UspA family protein [Natronoflexus pectinivorans]
MKRILVPVDFSEDSIFAVDMGLDIANLIKAKLRMMHVRTGLKYHPQFAKNNPDLALKDMDVDFMSYLMKRVRDNYVVENGQIDFKIREGNVVREITNQAHYDDSDLIVIGTHGVSGFEDRWLGSNAYRLVANAPCPVLAVRKEMVFKENQKILLPIDTEKVSRRIVPQVAQFARLSNASVLVAGINKKSRWFMSGRVNTYMHQVEKYLKKDPFLNVEAIQVDGSEGPKEMLKYAHEKDVTIIALPVRKTMNPFDSIFHPFANELLNLSDLPLLVVPERE